jgi:hypothetical protein
VIGHELAIKQQEMTEAKAGDEPRQRDLRCIGAAAEHGLAEKSAPQAHAVKAANQLARFAFALPALDRMRLPRGMKAVRSAFNLSVDPGFGPVGAGADDVGEDRVAGHREVIAPHSLGE